MKKPGSLRAAPVGCVLGLISCSWGLQRGYHISSTRAVRPSKVMPVSYVLMPLPT